MLEPATREDDRDEGHGDRSRDALIVVHILPPNRGRANVYGIRSADPIRLGIAVSQKS